MNEAHAEITGGREQTDKWNKHTRVRVGDNKYALDLRSRGLLACARFSACAATVEWSANAERSVSWEPRPSSGWAAEGWEGGDFGTGMNLRLPEGANLRSRVDLPSANNRGCSEGLETCSSSATCACSPARMKKASL